MDPAVVAAWIGGGFSIVGPIATFFAMKAYEGRFLEPLQADRKRALAGQWRGTIVQTSLMSDLSVSLEVSGRKITGAAELRFVLKGQDRHLVLRLVGGFLHDKFLKLDYTKKNNDGSIQFGSLIVELSSDARTLHGEYVGYGSITNAIVSGAISLSKEAA